MSLKAMHTAAMATHHKIARNTDSEVYYHLLRTITIVSSLECLFIASHLVWPAPEPRETERPCMESLSVHTSIHGQVPQLTTYSTRTILSSAARDVSRGSPVGVTLSFGTVVTGHWKIRQNPINILTNI